jgi:DNA-binding NarL/FixJ family response regulator
MNKISILIADDHKLIRETWSYILNNDSRFHVIAICATAVEAIELAKSKRPAIILMDINMAPVSGLEATEQIRKILPSSKIIGVTMYSQPAYAKKMLAIGARGYVTKNSSKEEMIKAILEVHHGNKYICDEIKNIVSEQLLAVSNHPYDINNLTERELEVVQLIKKGLSSREIADHLEISLKTVEVHRHNVLRKLNLKNSTSLVSFANTHSV